MSRGHELAITLTWHDLPGWNGGRSALRSSRPPRCSSASPRKTLPSFQEAIRAGADFIEFDVAVTRDNVPVISHDPVINLEICQGSGGKRPIHEITLDEVRQYDCGSLKPKAFPRQIAVPGTRIPTLEEVFDLAKSSTIRFNIEIKSSADWPANYALPPDELSRMVVDA